MISTMKDMLVHDLTVENPEMYPIDLPDFEKFKDICFKPQEAPAWVIQMLARVGYFKQTGQDEHAKFYLVVLKNIAIHEFDLIVYKSIRFARTEGRVIIFGMYEDTKLASITRLPMREMVIKMLKGQPSKAPKIMQQLENEIKELLYKAVELESIKDFLKAMQEIGLAGEMWKLIWLMLRTSR